VYRYDGRLHEACNEVFIAVALTRLSGQQNYQFGTVTSIFLLGGLLGAIFTGRILDKYGRRVAHRISSCIVLLGCVLLAGSSSFWTALVNRSFSGSCSFSPCAH
jgi:MFS family permease